MERRPLANERFRFHKLPEARLERECELTWEKGAYLGNQVALRKSRHSDMPDKC